jgi:transposase-like protein
MMANDHRRISEELAQAIFLLEDPTFLKEIVERVLQELLEAEMTEHIGVAPYERTHKRTGQRNGYKPRAALRTRVGKLNLLVPQDLNKKAPSALASSAATRELREGACSGADGRCTWRGSRPGRSRT